MESNGKAEGTLEDISLAQINVVKKLRLDLKDKLEKFPDLATAWSLLRFCRARDFQYDKVKQMLENFMIFREKVDYNRVMQSVKEDFKVITQNYARGWVGYDHEGRLVMVEKVSQSKPELIIGKVPDELVTDYFVNLYERLLYIAFPILSKIHNKRVDRTVLIIDLADVNLLKLFDNNLKNFLKFSSQMSQDYYPELLGKSFIVNAPWVFKGIWSIVKIWLDKKTTDKFVIESGPALDKLAEHMDISILPEYLGGQRKEPLNDFHGPWKDELNESWDQKSFYLKDRTPEFQYFYTDAERSLLMPAKPKHSTNVLTMSQYGALNSIEEGNDNVAQKVTVSSFKVHKYFADDI